MAIKSMFFNAVESGGTYDRTYNAEDFSSYLEKIVGNGVFPNPSTSLQVRQSTGMNVVVGAGHAWIDGHKIINTADTIFEVAAADTLLNRIDRVVFYIDYTNREMGIAIRKGTNASTPAAPAITRNNSLYEMSLATIYIAKQTTAITNSMITDTRADSTVCGWAAGLIDQVDTSTLYQQWEDAYATYYATTKEQLDDFMETLTQELGVNTYVVEYRDSTTFSKNSSTTFDFDIDGYTFNSTDIFKVFVNGMLLKETEYMLEVIQGLISVTLTNLNTAILPENIDNDIEIIVTKSIIGIENQIGG